MQSMRMKHLHMKAISMASEYLTCMTALQQQACICIHYLISIAIAHMCLKHLRVHEDTMVTALYPTYMGPTYMAVLQQSYGDDIAQR